MLKILYISNLCSEKVFNYIFDTSCQKPEQAAQKFHRLLAKGLSMNRDLCTLEALSSVPVVPSSHKRKLWKLKSETVEDIEIKYIPFVNIPFVKNLCIFVVTFFKVFLWSFSFSTRKRVIICDSLNLATSLASLWAGKITGTDCVAIVTDLPGMMITGANSQQKLISLLYGKIVRKSMTSFNFYILLTEQMNSIANPKKKPYIIIEGLVASEMLQVENKLSSKPSTKIMIYAGGLYEKYGVKTMIHAFMGLNDSNIALHLYGSGDLVKEILDYQLRDSRIIYKGIVPNKEVIMDQLKATLLINPRPTSEDFTKYSFPSKNMEYMVSGTPMICTKLPGMPKEYHDFIFLFKGEDVEGMRESFENILKQSPQYLHEYGLKAKAFVLNQKNNQIQARRFLEFYNFNFN